MKTGLSRKNHRCRQERPCRMRRAGKSPTVAEPERVSRTRASELNWADRALLAALLGVIPKARRCSSAWCMPSHAAADVVCTCPRHHRYRGRRGHRRSSGRVRRPEEAHYTSATRADLPGRQLISFGQGVALVARQLAR